MNKQKTKEEIKSFKTAVSRLRELEESVKNE